MWIINNYYTEKGMITMELTFNTDELIQKYNIITSKRPLIDVQINSLSLRFKLHQNSDTDFIIESSDLKKFLSETFCITFHTGCRNTQKLAKCIRQVTDTKKGVKSTLNFVEYKKLLLTDEFIKFIHDRAQEFIQPNNNTEEEELEFIQPNNNTHEEQLELIQKELTFLNYQKYKDEIPSLEKELLIESIAYILSNPKFSIYDELINYYNTFIDQYDDYKKYLNLPQNIMEGNIHVHEENTLKIIASRYTNKKNNIEYQTKKSLQDINEQTLIKNFLNDVADVLDQQNKFLENNGKIFLG